MRHWHSEVAYWIELNILLIDNFSCFNSFFFFWTEFPKSDGQNPIASSTTNPTSQPDSTSAGPSRPGPGVDPLKPYAEMQSNEEAKLRYQVPDVSWSGDVISLFLPGIFLFFIFNWFECMNVIGPMTRALM